VPEFRNGVFWVALAPLRDSTLVAPTIAHTLGATDDLAKHIGGRDLLLLLDNLEQVIDAAPELAALAEACPNLTFLVTSRERLRVRGEVEYPVSPLVDPDAVALSARARGFRPMQRSRNFVGVSTHCRSRSSSRSARTNLLSPRQILERLSRRLDLLEGRRDPEARQQTLRATIEWSYDQLATDERSLFARLAVFSGEVHGRGRRKGHRRRPRHDPGPRRQEPPKRPH
jgi:predicted ATPase